MRVFILLLVAIVVSSCKPTYMYEGQQRTGDPYALEWITSKNSVATCFVIDRSSKRIGASKSGLETSANRFYPDKDDLKIYDASGVLIETVSIRDYIYYCTSSGYTKIRRTNDISEFITGDYRDMSYDLIDHLISKGIIP